MELKTETSEEFDLLRLTRDDSNEKIKGDMLFCINDICNTLGVDLEWACDAMGRGFVFEYTFDDKKLRFTIKYGIGKLYDKVYAMSMSGRYNKTVGWINDYITWISKIEDEWVMCVEPSFANFLSKDDLSSVYEIKVVVYNIHNQVIKTQILDVFSTRELANTFIREYCKRVNGWKLNNGKECILASVKDTVDCIRRNPDGTTTKMFVNSRVVFNNWEAYLNKNAEDLRLCDLKF